MHCPGSALLSPSGTGKRQAVYSHSFPNKQLHVLEVKSQLSVAQGPGSQSYRRHLHPVMCSCSGFITRGYSQSRESTRGALVATRGVMWSLARVGVPGTLGGWHREATGLDIARVSFIRKEGPRGLRAEVLLPIAVKHATLPCPPLLGCLVSPNCRNKFSARRASNP